MPDVITLATYHYVPTGTRCAGVLRGGIIEEPTRPRPLHSTLPTCIFPLRFRPAAGAGTGAGALGKWAMPTPARLHALVLFLANERCR
jgi:hypothetical protein